MTTARIRIPVSGDVIPGTVDEHGMGIKRLEEFEFAYVVFTGPLTKIRTTVDSLVGWTKENGYDVVGPLEEVYFSDPSGTAPEELVTEVGFPVKRTATA